MLFVIFTTPPLVWFTYIYAIFQQLLLDVWYFNRMQSFSGPWFGLMLYNLTNHNLFHMSIHWHGRLHQLSLSIISDMGRIHFIVDCTILGPHAVKRPNLSVIVEEIFPSSILTIRQQFSALKEPSDMFKDPQFTINFVEFFLLTL